ncbi:MAG: Fe-S cluster assembly protein SufB [Deltaproteobacteria bacterium]|nr:Fe-S cluster assembly protein SufB [Deltaproteobacteria bacterium]
MTQSAVNDIGRDYETQYGFHVPENYVFKSGQGLTRRLVEEISEMKGEPAWMRDFRLRALAIYLKKPMPTWGNTALLGAIDFENIHYYVRPMDRQGKNWEEVPEEIRNTFDKLGIPEAERKFLAGVTAQYESEVVYHSIQKELEAQGVIFLGMDDGLKQYPDLVKEHFATVIPAMDNKFAALNSAVWSGGSFIYVPKGVHVAIPLQAYFRINTENMGQFERTLIIADEGSSVHYIEGCFTKGTKITTNPAYKNIEEVRFGDRVLTHSGRYADVSHVQKRLYTGTLYTIEPYGDATQKIAATADHPFVAVRRQLANERNRTWEYKWIPAKTLRKGDYLAMPVDRTVRSTREEVVMVPIGHGRHEYKEVAVVIPSTPAFFRLAGYYLAEGSVSSGHYLNFSFHEDERVYIDEVKSLLHDIFHAESHETCHRKNHGTNVVVNSTALARVFTTLFGRNAAERKIPEWMRWEAPAKQRELIRGLFRGDGNYYCRPNRHGRKELFRISTISETSARQVRDILLRLGVVGAINCQTQRGPGRKPMYNVCIGGEQAQFFGALVGTAVRPTLNNKKRATMFHIDAHFAYLPIKRITARSAKNIPVFNFGVHGDESYVAGGVAVHNCTAPTYSSDSLHSAVVELIARPGAKIRYTTIQNWSKNVYNLVTKRGVAYRDATIEWVDGNLGSKLTMKYPAVYMVEPGARAEILSVAFSGSGQHQDAGAKVIHAAPHTSSVITSKSISKDGGRTSYRGLVKVNKDAKDVKCNVRCDALLLDEASRSDTYPTMEIDEDDVQIGHEATVSKVGDEQLYYLRSRGLSENDAILMIVNGFIEPFTKELPLEYAVELNRLIQLEMAGSVG